MKLLPTDPESAALTVYERLDEAGRRRWARLVAEQWLDRVSDEELPGSVQEMLNATERSCLAELSRPAWASERGLSELSESYESDPALRRDAAQRLLAVRVLELAEISIQEPLTLIELLDRGRAERVRTGALDLLWEHARAG